MSVFDEAAEVLGDVLKREDAAGASATDRGQTLWLLGQALRASGEPGAAAVAWEAAAGLFEGAESWAAAAQAGHSLGGLHLEHGHGPEAVAALDRALAAARHDPQDTESLTHVLHVLARARAATGDESAILALDEAEAHARAAEARWLVADLTDSRARVIAALGRVEEAVPVARAASNLYLEAGDPGAGGGALLLAARMLRALGHLHDSVTAYRGALELLETSPAGSDVARTELAELLDELG
jgi:tetratricopeptide (TPR) repeat protein